MRPHVSAVLAANLADEIRHNVGKADIAPPIGSTFSNLGEGNAGEAQLLAGVEFKGRLMFIGPSVGGG
jgi:hypothetical protein